MFRLFTICRVALVCALLAISSVARSELITATANLDYSQEVAPSNPSPSTATGTATVLFDTTTGLLDLAAEISGIFLADVTFPSGGLAFGAAGPFHIHQAPAGANGGIVVPFSEESFFTETVSGLSVSAMDVSFGAELIAPLLAGDLYLNLHSLDYGSGEIRGQLAAAVPAPGAVALLGIGILGLAIYRRRPGH
jgi:hypothetical protein